MALPPDRELIAIKIATTELAKALVQLVGATGGGDAAPDANPLPAAMGLAESQAAFDDLATLYRRRAAMLLAREANGAAFLLKLEKGIAAHLTGFLNTPEGRGGTDILAAVGGMLRPILLEVRGAGLPGRQQ